MTYRVVLSDQKTIDVETGLEVQTPSPRTPEAVLDALEGADGLIVDAATPVTAEVLERAASLRVIGRAGIGVDNVDVVAAAANDVVVLNVPDYAIEEVSTHALALLLACVRKVPLYDREVKNGHWSWEDGRPLHRLQGKTVGLLAYGAIARRFAEKLAGFGVEVIAHDPYVSSEAMADAGIEKVDRETLLETSDVLSVHAPLTDETENSLDAEAFGTMPEDAIVVNTARGGVIDSDALEEALSSGAIAAAGLDVFDPEPPEDSPLLDRENVVLTPHTAWYSEESRRELSRSIAGDVLRVLNGEEPNSPVDPDSGWF
ncbi:C-terminal binding protein [Halobacteriales archaeon QS_3_64_16]|nr:MAG: C-terminal binding protein [Halobacteriales archaeon QS_3_64_16]